MIPLRDTIEARSRPLVTRSLIAANVVVFLVQLAQGPHLDRFIFLYGLVPARYFVPEFADYFTFGEQALALLSFMFLHGGFGHLLGNLWSLYIFGDNVEDHLGPLRYLGFYLLSGLASGLAHMLIYPHSTVPTIGASGAIAGVMGAYFLLFPGARILTLVPILFIPYFFEIPAFFYLGIWFLLQFLNAAGASGEAGGVAWWAHIGGFVFGMLLVKIADRVPRAGLSDPLRRLAASPRTDRLRMLHPEAQGDSGDRLAVLTVSPWEAELGARKLIAVPGRFGNRMLRVTVPPGVREGMRLRLRGLGAPRADGGRGDLLLEIRIRPF